MSQIVLNRIKTTSMEVSSLLHGVLYVLSPLLLFRDEECLSTLGTVNLITNLFSYKFFIASLQLKAWRVVVPSLLNDFIIILTTLVLSQPSNEDFFYSLVIILTVISLSNVFHISYLVEESHFSYRDKFNGIFAVIASLLILQLAYITTTRVVDHVENGGQVLIQFSKTFLIGIATTFLARLL